MKQETLKLAIKDILKGIDQTEIESSDGWWETSTGAKFGAEKLKQILEALAQTQEPVTLQGEDYRAMYLKVRDELAELQQRTWVGLTDEDDIDWEDGGNLKDLVKAIEAKLKEKNNV